MMTMKTWFSNLFSKGEDTHRGGKTFACNKFPKTARGAPCSLPGRILWWLQERNLGGECSLNNFEALLEVQAISIDTSQIREHVDGTDLETLMKNPSLCPSLRSPEERMRMAVGIAKVTRRHKKDKIFRKKKQRQKNHKTKNKPAQRRANGDCWLNKGSAARILKETSASQ